MLQNRARSRKSSSRSFARGRTSSAVNFSKLGVARNAWLLLCSTADLGVCFEDDSDVDAMGSHSEPLKQMRKADVDDIQWERFVGACLRDVEALSKCKDEENIGNSAMDRPLTTLMSARESELMIAAAAFDATSCPLTSKHHGDGLVPQWRASLGNGANWSAVWELAKVTIMSEDVSQLQQELQELEKKLDMQRQIFERFASMLQPVAADQKSSSELCQLAAITVVEQKALSTLNFIKDKVAPRETVQSFTTLMRFHQFSSKNLAPCLQTALAPVVKGRWSPL